MFRPIKIMGLAISCIYFVTNCALAYPPEGNVWSDRRKLPASQSNGDPQTLLASLPSAWSLSGPPALLNRFPPVFPTSLETALPRRFEGKIPPNVQQRLASLIQALPPQWGSLRSLSIPAGEPCKKILIHIQDVHRNTEAQTNIGKTIQELINQKKVDLVALEGAFAPVDVSAFRRFPDPKIVRDVADHLLAQKKISGPIHTALTSLSPLPLFIGVDDAAHYESNVEAYRNSAPSVKEQKRRLAIRSAAIKKEKTATMNARLLEFDRSVERYHRGGMPLGDYAQLLCRMASPTPQVKTYREAFEMEAGLDFSRIEAERTRLISQLSATLSQAQLSEFLARSVACRIGNAAQADLYAYLVGLCQEKGILLGRYPALNSYLRYVLLTNQIDGDQLFRDVHHMEEMSYARLVRNSEEKNILKESTQLLLTEKLLDFSLTRDEWEDYRALELGRRNSKSQTNQGPMPTVPTQERGLPPITPHSEFIIPPSFESFYSEAIARDRAMADNLFDAMDKNRASVAVLVTGGFHSTGIEKAMKEKGIITLSFVPKITSVDSEKCTAYLGVFTQEKTPLEKLFAGEKLFLAERQLPPPTKTWVATLIAGLGVRDGLNLGAMQTWFNGAARPFQLLDVQTSAAGVVVSERGPHGEMKLALDAASFELTLTNGTHLLHAWSSLLKALAVIRRLPADLPDRRRLEDNVHYFSRMIGVATPIGSLVDHFDSLAEFLAEIPASVDGIRKDLEDALDHIQRHLHSVTTIRKAETIAREIGDPTYTEPIRAVDVADYPWGIPGGLKKRMDDVMRRNGVIDDSEKSEIVALLPELLSHWANLVGLIAVPDNAPLSDTTGDDAREWLRRLMPLEWDHIELIAGMGFGNFATWWGDHSPRPVRHSGLDVARGKNRNGRSEAIPDGTVVTAMTDGTVMAVVDDEMGQTIFVETNLLDSRGRRLVINYTHITLVEGSEGKAPFVAGQKINKGTALGFIRDSRNKKALVPRHLHISTAWMSGTACLRVVMAINQWKRDRSKDKGPVWKVIDPLMDGKSFDYFDPLELFKSTQQTLFKNTEDNVVLIIHPIKDPEIWTIKKPLGRENPGIRIRDERTEDWESQVEQMIELGYHLDAVITPDLNIYETVLRLNADDRQVGSPGTELEFAL